MCHLIFYVQSFAQFQLMGLFVIFSFTSHLFVQIFFKTSAHLKLNIGWNRKCKKCVNPGCKQPEKQSM